MNHPYLSLVPGRTPLAVNRDPSRRYDAGGAVRCLLLPGDRPAEVLNLSGGGAGLVLAEPLAVGSAVSLRLEDRGGSFACPAGGRVAHCAARPAGGYSCGVAFAEPLALHALGRLLG